LLLPEVDYFQVVFTLPQALSALALGNRRTLYKLLFRSASQALTAVMAEQFGLEAASLMVLHTWNQRLEHHPHVHLLVPGGGPSLDGKRWIKTRHPKHRNKRRPYLVNNRLLSERFREVFLKSLERLQRKGELRVSDLPAFRSLLSTLRDSPWVVYIQAPPHENASPEQVIKYLARYMTGGPISDQRLVSHESGKVTIRARSTGKPSTGKPSTGKSTDGSPLKQVHVPLDGVEFVRRWSLHILPKGFVKVRRYGGFSNRNREAYLELCRQLLGLVPTSTDPPNEVDVNEFEGETPEEVCNDKCPKCSESMTCVSHQDKPSWSRVMPGSACPFWYRDG
jgi:Putative transposase